MVFLIKAFKGAHVAFYDLLQYSLGVLNHFYRPIQIVKNEFIKLKAIFLLKLAFCFYISLFINTLYDGFVLYIIYKNFLLKRPEKRDVFLVILN